MTCCHTVILDVIAYITEAYDEVVLQVLVNAGASRSLKENETFQSGAVSN